MKGNCLLYDSYSFAYLLELMYSEIMFLTAQPALVFIVTTVRSSQRTHRRQFLKHWPSFKYLN